MSEEKLDRGLDGFRSLLEEAQGGDRKAMDRVLGILRPYLEPIARPYANPTRPAQSASDLVQEGCLRAWQKLDRFEIAEDDEGTFALFRAWVGQIVRRLGMDAQRAGLRQRRSPQKKIVSIGSPPSDDSAASGGAIDPPGRSHRPSAYARGRELDEEIGKALDRMPDQRDAVIVRMHAFEGLSLTEISQRLDLGYDLVREHYWATIERLKRQLADWL